MLFYYNTFYNESVIESFDILWVNHLFYWFVKKKKKKVFGPVLIHTPEVFAHDLLSTYVDDIFTVFGPSVKMDVKTAGVCRTFDYPMIFDYPLIVL